jgi:3-phenylpropionate/trans-cinnamate dioxygenase ferredoxin reductase component
MAENEQGETFVVAGASLAGATTAAALRDEAFDGRIVLIGDEAERPYERPPLSKEYLQGKSEKEKIYVHPEDWYASHEVELILETRVTDADGPAHEVTLSDGQRLGYSKLVLATGSSPRRLSVPGEELESVLYLRRVEDSEQIKETLGSVSRIAVIGGGWIGLEVTAAARLAGVEVTLVEQAELPLLRVLGPEVAEIFADLHRGHGVDLRFGEQLEEITGDGDRVRGVRLSGGEIDAEAVVVGVGITPNTALAEAAGLGVDDGVVVDEFLRSSDPDVYAVGDVASAFHPLFGRHIRVEHWANALNQPKYVAKTMVGRPTAYDRVPYFFTDQYDLGMEYSGYVEPGGYDQVVFRGDRDGGEFIAFWLKDNRVLAGMNVNVWDVTNPIQAIIRSRQRVDLQKLADVDVPLADVSR